jgi:hypothetical protein
MTMSDEELEDAFIRGMTLRIYTSRIGHFVACRVVVLYWHAKPDAFIIEATERGQFYWIQRSDPSLIVKRA